MPNEKVIGTTQLTIFGTEETNMNVMSHYREWAYYNKPYDDEDDVQYNTRMRCGVIVARAPMRNFLLQASKGDDEEFAIMTRCLAAALGKESMETHVRASRKVKEELGAEWAACRIGIPSSDDPMLEWEKYLGGHDHPESEPRAFQQITRAVPVSWRKQFEVGPYRFDMVHEASKTLIELNSFEHHLNKAAFVRDILKMRYGQVRGYVVMPIAFTEFRGGDGWKSDLQWAVQR